MLPRRRRPSPSRVHCFHECPRGKVDPGGYASGLRLNSRGCGPYLEVDCKRGHLLREAEEVDGSVEKAGLKLRLEINRSTSTSRYVSCAIPQQEETLLLFVLLRERSDIGKEDDVDRELDQD